MDRRVVLACLALAGLCRCTLFFGLDALDQVGDSSPDAGSLKDVAESDAAEDATTNAGDADATIALADAEDGDSSVSSATDSRPETEANAGTDGGRLDASRADGSQDGSGSSDGEGAADAPPLVNMVPAGYTGTPFKTLTIPGTIYLADYDQGGAGVAYCYKAGVSGGDCGNGIDLADWCCGTISGCDERLQPTLCPIYRADADNAGLSHMNQGAPDDYAASGPSWASSAEGPTLTGPMVTAGTPAPQDAHTTTEQDVYLSHTQSGEWVKYTVQVLEAGKYAVGGFMAVPPTTTVSLNFGNGITTGTLALPTSPCTWTGCASTFHSWSILSNLATVTFPVAGTYLMTFTVVNNALNPNYFTFTKM